MDKLRLSHDSAQIFSGSTQAQGSSLDVWQVTLQGIGFAKSFRLNSLTPRAEGLYRCLMQQYKLNKLYFEGECMFAWLAVW